MLLILVFLAHMCALECVQVAVSSVRHICAGDAQYTPCKLAKDTLVLVFAFVFVFVFVSSCERDEMCRRSLHPLLTEPKDTPVPLVNSIPNCICFSYLHMCTY